MSDQDRDKSAWGGSGGGGSTRESSSSTPHGASEYGTSQPYGGYGEQAQYGSSPGYGGYAQQGQYGQQGQYEYGYQPYGQRSTDQTAIWALVLAIAAWVVCPLIPAIVALFLARTAERNIAASGGQLDGDGLAKAGRIVAWLNIGLWVAIALIVVVAVAFAAATGSM